MGRELKKIWWLLTHNTSTKMACQLAKYCQTKKIEVIWVILKFRHLDKAIFQHALITYSHASCSKISPLCLLLGETTTRLDQYLPYFLSSHPQLHSCFPPDHPCIRLAGWPCWLADCLTDWLHTCQACLTAHSCPAAWQPAWLSCLVKILKGLQFHLQFTVQKH